MHVDEDLEEILSAFADGEHVEAARFERALMAPGGRETLIGIVSLKERFALDDAAPSPAWYARQPFSRTARTTARFWLTAAALAVLTLAGAALLTKRTSPAQPVPPEPDRVIELEWGAA